MKAMIKAGQAWSKGTVKGAVVHAVPDPFPGYASGGPQFNPALCGAAPSGRSYGWEESQGEVTCPKCRRKLAEGAK